jgi:hypothetical protein
VRCVVALQRCRACGTFRFGFVGAVFR